MSKLIFGDLHLDMWRAFNKVTPDGSGTRLAEQIRVMQEVVDIAVKNDVDGIYFLGDFFHSKSEKISKTVMMVASGIVRALTSVAPTYLICGNHDIYNGNSIITYLMSDNLFPVITTTRELIYDRDLYMVPYGCILPDKVEKDSILFGHYGIRGASMNGYIPKDDLDVPVSELLKYSLVIMGHYHTRQALDKKILHAGAVMCNSFNDSDEDRGVLLLEEDLKLKFVPIKSPKFYTRTINKQSDVSKHFVTGGTYDYYKLIITSDDITLPKLPDNVIVEWDIKLSPKEHVTETEKATSLDKDVIEFIKNSNTALDKDKLIEMAQEIMERV
jgi:DNA repair exonuclease SbcCD nuclease subunit